MDMSQPMTETDTSTPQRILPATPQVHGRNGNTKLTQYEVDA
ncbi:MAG: hypothetical protein QOD10_2469, partial [Mycobacterium sp.]|nr:hypothetical protein [Mycobacterium sp.]